jgi:hypothetical protein
MNHMNSVVSGISNDNIVLSTNAVVPVSSTDESHNKNKQYMNKDSIQDKTKTTTKGIVKDTKYNRKSSYHSNYDNNQDIE